MRPSKDKLLDIMDMNDGLLKMLKLYRFAGACMPQCQLWLMAMNEFHRLYNLGYWKWQDESKQNG